MYVIPLGTPVIAWVGKIVIAEGPQLGNSMIVDTGIDNYSERGSNEVWTCRLAASTACNLNRHRQPARRAIIA
jgi:hypothetical protein